MSKHHTKKSSRNSGAGGISIQDAVRLAQAHYDAGQTPQAESLCRQILAVNPKNFYALHMLGLIALAHHHDDAAIGLINEACKVAGPACPPPYLSNLAELLRRRGRLAEAMNAATSAVRLDPTAVTSWNNLGIILQESGRLEESRQALERVVVAQPQNAEAHNNLGNTYWLLGRNDEAKQEWTLAIQANPNYASPYVNLANLLQKEAAYAEAAQAARKAVELAPRFAEAHINLAEIYACAGKADLPMASRDKHS